MVEHQIVPGLRLGIVGGGQLGRMIAMEARRMGIYTVCLDPQEHPPAEGVADVCIQGDLYAQQDIQRLAEQSHVLTYEIEHINTRALEELCESGFPVFPSPGTLKVIQDKLVQKQLFQEAGLPVPRFAPWSGGTLPRGFSYPMVQKIRTGGYDGRGVAVLRKSSDPVLPGESMVEDLVDFRCEIAVLLARGRDGEVRHWPVIEMVFDPQTQICSSVCAPARISPDAAQAAITVSTRAVEALDGVGVFAVELFLTHKDEVLINEVAPRPHNSGHWTIEGSLTSQFNQHLRAVCGLPLGSTELTMPSVMVNLLGAPGASGTPVIRGYDEVLAIPGLSMHWYEKDQVKTQRKMGHMTIMRPSLEEALNLATQAQGLIQIEGVE
jgi:5-(carboxyamino)imidazole ribonucleotide synthase